MATQSTAFEQGPIRPPSEAHSLLVRVSRNCPWNKCAFCPVYKRDLYSRRTVGEVVADLDVMLEEFGPNVETVFLQDANPLQTKVDDLVPMIEAIRERFPRVRRVTTYARSKTLARRSLEDLKRIRKAGLDRVHVGMESGNDQVLELVRKGSTREEQILGGHQAKAAGFELSEYVMPGLGGEEHSDAHADDSASALVAIKPDFIRLRTTAVIPGTTLEELQNTGRFVPLSDVALVEEIRRFLSGLRGLQTRLESDHMLNLLMELRGDLPRDLDRLIGICDSFLGLPELLKNKYVLARRMGWMGDVGELGQVASDPRIAQVLSELEEQQVAPEEFFRKLRTRMV